MHLFLAELPDPDPGAGSPLVLTGEEAHHARAVLRVRPGELVALSDGLGRGALCRVAALAGGQVHLTVVRPVREEPPSPRVVAVQALLKGDAAALAVDLLTEAGVDVIVPWAAQRCLARWTERSGARWRSWARAAAKQSRRLHVPEVTPPASLDQVAARLAAAALPVVLHEGARAGLGELAVAEAEGVVVVVGPEGGLTDAELDRLGGPTHRLGATVLRGATAGAFATMALLPACPRRGAQLPWWHLEDGG